MLLVAPLSCLPFSSNMVYQLNVPVGPAKPGETAPYRNARVKEGAVSRPLGYKCTTVTEFFDECVAKHGSSQTCEGWRDLKDLHFEKKMVKKMVSGKIQEVEKEWMYYEMSDYKYLTFGQLKENNYAIGRGLVELGVKPGNTDRLMIFASTSPKWMRMFLGTQTQNIPIVTAYDSLGVAGLTTSLTDTDAVAVFTDNDLLVRLAEPLKTAKAVKYIIHTEPIDPADKRGEGRIYAKAKKGAEELLKVRPDIKLISYDEVLELGKKAKDIKPSLAKPEDLSCIMYTSGSTGAPKGVYLTHANVVAGIGGVGGVVGNDIVSPSDRVIAFLPLAHIFELVFELIGFWWGCGVGYASVKTLTDRSCRNCEGDMKAFKPTIMVGVAAVWETIKKGIMQQISELPSFKQRMFWGAYNAKEACQKLSIPVVPSLIDNLVFKQIKQATGGHLRYVLNGGSPISGATQRFISCTICPMLIGYGLTETVANTCVTDPRHFVFDMAGSLVLSVTVKLIDVPEAGYFAKNNQGEVLIRGNSVMKGYYKRPEETKEVFGYEDGWFSTGDVGQWMENGGLKLIDRRKNLIKTQNGEYIALEKLESIYRSNPLVSNICCYADQTKVKAIGIVFPVLKSFQKLVVSLGLAKKEEDVQLADYIKNKKVAAAMTKSLLQTAKKAQLTKIEMILGVVLIDDEWTPENGFVTSAQKLQRRKILNSVKDRVDLLYSENQ